jgi:hypothetical protein
MVNGGQQESGVIAEPGAACSSTGVTVGTYGVVSSSSSHFERLQALRDKIISTRVSRLVRALSAPAARRSAGGLSPGLPSDFWTSYRMAFAFYRGYVRTLGSSPCPLGSFSLAGARLGPYLAPKPKGHLRHTIQDSGPHMPLACAQSVVAVTGKTSCSYSQLQLQGAATHCCCGLLLAASGNFWLLAGCEDPRFRSATASATSPSFSPRLSKGCFTG